jgi:hypothetical protein
LDAREAMWFQQDGAPPHFNIAVRRHLDAHFPNRWIGRGGPIAWPPRSPDLTPPDFWLWGHIKTLVYTTPVDTRDDLITRIRGAVDTINATPDTFAHVRRNMLQRCTACVANGGRHFENTL